MHVWIDIDDEQDVPFYKVFITALKGKGHIATVTALDKKEIKDKLNQYDLDARITGKLCSFFGIWEKYFHVLRGARLAKYIFPRNIDISFSFGSLSMLFASIDVKIPTAQLITDYYKDKIHLYYAVTEKCYFIFSDTVSDQLITERGVDT